MVKQKWFQKMPRREIAGEVVNKRLSIENPKHKLMTLYTIVGNGKEYYCASIGHELSPIIGDTVNVCVLEGKILTERSTSYKVRKPDGSIRYGEYLRGWEKIKKLSITGYGTEKNPIGSSDDLNNIGNYRR